MASDPFVAEIMLIPYNFAPKGWAFCQGQILSISQNTALFSLLGTTYGGDGRTNFALPDLQGRVPVHEGQGPGLQLIDLGEVGGSTTYNLVAANLPPHTHAVQSAVNFKANSAAGTVDLPTANYPANLTGSNNYATTNVNGTPAGMGPLTLTISPAGNATPAPIDHSPPYLVMNYIIALQGVFPARN